MGSETLNFMIKKKTTKKTKKELTKKTKADPGKKETG